MNQRMTVPYEIEITNTQDYLDVDETALRRVAERTLAEERVAEARLSVGLVGNSAIRELNRRYLGHDWDTDVLSFLLECEGGPGKTPAREPPRGAGKRIEGEVIVSAEMARGRAAEFHWSPRDELILYLVHGLLHLAGYDDRSERERCVMRSREREILNRCRISPPEKRPGEADATPETADPEDRNAGEEC